MTIKLITHAFNRAASTYDAVAKVQRIIAEKLLQRLDFFTIAPQHILDLGAGTGFCTRYLQHRYPQARCYALDIAFNMLKQANLPPSVLSLTATANAIPLLSQQMAMVVSNLMLQWCDDLPGVLAEVARVLRPGGLFIFSTFGPDTLKELRQAWQALGEPKRVNAFYDLHEIGDLLLHQSFSEPVLMRETIELHYRNPSDILKDLHALGSSALHKSTGLITPRRYQQLLANFPQTAAGQYPLTYEVIYGVAFVAEERLEKPSRVSLDRLKQTIKGFKYENQ